MLISLRFKCFCLRLQLFLSKICMLWTSCNRIRVFVSRKRKRNLSSTCEKFRKLFARDENFRTICVFSFNLIDNWNNKKYIFSIFEWNVSYNNLLLLDHKFVEIFDNYFHRVRNQISFFSWTWVCINVFANLRRQCNKINYLSK